MLDSITKNMESWLIMGPKTPGLVILEHESADQTVKAFTDSFPKISNNGWRAESLSKILGSVYQNVQGGVVTPDNVYNYNGAASLTSGASPTQSTNSTLVGGSKAPVPTKVNRSSASTSKLASTTARPQNSASAS
ncbi:hypothetical protein PM082_001961 [Marasmius tenuissimus]|nr:hypothetical protein PM082_001961 [Marasmius tenuissimus]